MTVYAEICAWYCHVGTGLAVPLGLREEGTAVIIKFRLAEHTVCVCVCVCVRARAQTCVRAIVIYFTS